MLSLIRRSKLGYIVYNFFHKKQLGHNVPLYKKLGLKKKYYSPVSSADFKGLAPERLKPSIPQKQLAACGLFQKLDQESRQSLLQFQEQGFAVIRGYLDENMVEAVNNAIEELVRERKARFRFKKSIMFAFRQIPLINEIGNNEELLELLACLIQGHPTLFQSKNFLQGSELHTHSDSIHMTTFPLGGLLGVWIALEDVDSENGPLHYYPGSHTIPYYLNSDYGNEGNKWWLGPKDYADYEAMVQEKIRELGLNRQYFTARKGDLIIWHANLMHGGEPHLNKNRTRRSMVFHYYDTDCICYHEITQRPALFY
ncbi:phytanoyl-CoA dioxygenase family protein [Flavihumibacter rivuli]|uniref:phytanoyl-CoA dioxygenase family protein n=1 Tax=Flavihumibacter rivuli TaxID=2838156 RepID=UPI001BDE1DDE|nr:phytanoyl-CoA dioxygenase family protein [Flavihumibacter rivuli]ULQ57924.1 phytanoyl-CoA dioxygenase family protein [Flavihumibacter rivuli]